MIDYMVGMAIITASVALIATVMSFLFYTSTRNPTYADKMFCRISSAMLIGSPLSGIWAPIVVVVVPIYFVVKSLKPAGKVFWEVWH